MRLQIYILTICVVLFSGFAVAYGQEKRTTNPEVGQIKLSISDNKDTDTAKIFQLVELANPIKLISTDSARQILAEAYELAKKMNFPDGLAATIIEYAACDLYDGDYDQAIEKLYLTQEYIRNAQSDLSSIILRLYNYLAVTYNYIGRDDYSLYYHYKSLQFAMQYLHSHNELKAYIPLAFTNIGITLYRTRQYQQSLYYLHNAERFSLALQQYQYLGEIYINIAKNYRIRTDWPKHDYYVREALKWNDTLSQYSETQSNRQYTSILSSIGESYLQRDQPKKALEYFQRARAITNSINPYDNKLLIDKGMGSAYLQMGNYPKAKEHLLAALDIATELKVRSPITASLYHNLSDYYYKTGDLNNAYIFQKRYSELNDSLLLSERQQDINRLEIQYRASEMDKSIALQDLLLARKAKELKDKNILIAGTTIIAIVLIFMIFSIRRHNKHKREIDNLHAKLEGGEQERSRIGRELHDGIMVQFSAVKMNLSSLVNQFQHLPGIEAFREPIAQLDAATRELRRTAHNLMPAVLLKEGLTDAVFFFCKNLEQSVPISIHVQSYGDIPRLNPEAELSIYRIIQELVHNVIKHANATEALVELSGQNNLLMISVEDNGVGMSASAIDPSNSGFGLSTVRSRTTALNGQIDVKSAPNSGTVVNIEFEMKYLVSDKSMNHAY